MAILSLELLNDSRGMKPTTLLLRIGIKWSRISWRMLERFLCIQPHPDDMDMAAGGTVAWLKEKVTQIVILIFIFGRQIILICRVVTI